MFKSTLSSFHVIVSFNLSTIKSQNSIYLKPKYEGSLEGPGVARHIIGHSILDIKQNCLKFKLFVAKNYVFTRLHNNINQIETENGATDVML